MSENTTALETMVHFSDYQNETITSIKVSLENNMSLIVEKGVDGSGNAGVTITLKDDITESIEVSAFVVKGKLQSLIKILNTMYRQATSNPS